MQKSIIVVSFIGLLTWGVIILAFLVIEKWTAIRIILLVRRLSQSRQPSLLQV